MIFTCEKTDSRSKLIKKSCQVQGTPDEIGILLRHQ